MEVKCEQCGAPMEGRGAAMQWCSETCLQAWDLATKKVVH